MLGRMTIPRGLAVLQAMDPYPRTFGEHKLDSTCFYLKKDKEDMKSGGVRWRREERGLRLEEESALY